MKCVPPSGKPEMTGGGGRVCVCRGLCAQLDTQIPQPALQQAFVVDLGFRVCVCVSVDCWCPWGAEGKLNRACEPAIPHGQGLGRAACVPPPILYLFSFAGFSVAPRG